jgi:hypothetical protein
VHEDDVGSTHFPPTAVKETGQEEQRERNSEALEQVERRYPDHSDTGIHRTWRPSGPRTAGHHGDHQSSMGQANGLGSSNLLDSAHVRGVVVADDQNGTLGDPTVRRGDGHR